MSGRLRTVEDEQALTRAEARALLAYADVTYRSVTSLRRRVATIALAVAVLFGVLCIVSTVQWAGDRARLARVTDEALVDVLGVQVPDPRPAIERGQIRVQILLWGFGAATSGAVTLLFLAIYCVLRPPALPSAVRELNAAAPPTGQPPM